MLRPMMKSKIHRATVTQADLHYVGSVTVDEDLLDTERRGGFGRTWCSSRRTTR